ncbi:MAG: hemolysin III family protein [Hyphomicrobiaceae bacterium]
MKASLAPREHKADTIVHVSGIVAGVVAVTVMLVAAARHLPLASTASLAIYGSSMLAMFACSASYHMIPSARWTGVLQRLDHAAIFLKIAGTYTPFAAIKIGGIAGFGLLGLVWLLALIGAAGKLLLTSTWDRIAIPLYLVLGWIGLAMLKPLMASVSPTSIVLLGIGGLLYTVGVIFHVWRSLPYQKAIWHGFVLAGTGCHFGAVTSAMFL